MQRVFPRILKTFLPLAIPTTIAWEPIIRGVIDWALRSASCLRCRRCCDFGACRRCAFFGPMSRLRRTRRTDPILWLVYALIVAGVTGFAISQTETLTRGLVFAAALGVAVGIFAGVAKLLILGIRKFFPHGWSFVLRQGLANLYRPNNRTLLLTLSLGLGTFLLLNLYLSREVLLAQFQSVGARDQANIFLFDIQPDQKAGVAEIVESWNADYRKRLS
jgi:putative ABC transport system permease protein